MDRSRKTEPRSAAPEDNDAEPTGASARSEAPAAGSSSTIYDIFLPVIALAPAMAYFIPGRSSAGYCGGGLCR